MIEPNIHHVITVLRSFNNEITVKSLSDTLHISYSTLARCKSGVCPPSVTYSALKNAFDTYKALYFKDDDTLVANALFQQLQKMGINPSPWKHVFAEQGYEGLITSFLSDSLANSTVKASEAGVLREKANTTPEHANATPVHTNTAPEQAKPAGQDFTFLAFLPIAVIATLGLFQIPLGNAIQWMADHTAAFVGLSFLIAVLPTIVGFAIDAPLAWRAARKENSQLGFSYNTFARVAKYGAANAIMPGRGRFNAAPSQVVYALLCNMLGMLCYLALFAFLIRQPGFLDYVNSHNWIEYFKISVAIAFFIAYRHTYSLQIIPRPTAADDAYNPDNYLWTRAHVWANCVHLVWTISLCCILALCMVGYGIAHFREIPLPAAILFPVAAAMLFLLYANTSPYALRVRVSSVGSFISGSVALSLAMGVFALACYRASWASLVLLVLCAGLLVFAWKLRKQFLQSGDTSWIERGKQTTILGSIIAIAILGMIVVSLFTIPLV